MNKKSIIALIDYKGYFESKYTSIPYNSGMDKMLLKKYFEENGYTLNFLNFSQIDFRKNNYVGQLFLYTSSEDTGMFYKAYIEDVILGLTLNGAIVLPAHKFLRANNNKVFMEILRDQIHSDSLKTISSYHFGSMEELKSASNLLPDVSVIKPAEGAMSRGVGLAHGKYELFRKSKKISRTKNWFRELWELGRSLKYKNYIRESKYRKKFIVQNFIPNLNNDWKILIYGDKYFILFRENRVNDFRASGGGRLSFTQSIPNGILEFAKIVYDSLNVPNLSIDVAFDNNQFYLIEFQALYFGTYTIEFSPFFFIKEKNQWIIKTKKSILEKVYTESVSLYINKTNLL